MTWAKRQLVLLQRWAPGRAGGWGLPGPMIRRPPSAPVHQFTSVRRVAIRGGEGTKTATVSAAGSATISLGPEAMITWYVDYVAIQTTSGANDSSTCAATVGPVGHGLVPTGQSYVGGGDVISLGGRAMRPGEYITMVWSGGKSGDQAIATVYGSQDILT